MPTYKLTYFNMTAYAEAIRYMFHYGGIIFEDERLNYEEWKTKPKYKADTPMGQVPVLMIDDKKYDQSRAIGRYVAKKCNLYGLDELEALEIDAAVDSIDDMRQVVFNYCWERNSAIREKFKEIAFQKLPCYLDKFEEQVKKNNGHFIGGKLSWADFIYAAYTEYLNNSLMLMMHLDKDPTEVKELMDKTHTKVDLNKTYPELKKLVDKIHGLPNVKAYLEKCPKPLY